MPMWWWHHHHHGRLTHAGSFITYIKCPSVASEHFFFQNTKAIGQKIFYTTTYNTGCLCPLALECLDFCINRSPPAQWIRKLLPLYNIYIFRPTVNRFVICCSLWSSRPRRVIPCIIGPELKCTSSLDRPLQEQQHHYSDWIIHYMSSLHHLAELKYKVRFSSLVAYVESILYMHNTTITSHLADPEIVCTLADMRAWESY